MVSSEVGGSVAGSVGGSIGGPVIFNHGSDSYITYLHKSHAQHFLVSATYVLPQFGSFSQNSSQLKSWHPGNAHGPSFPVHMESLGPGFSSASSENFQNVFSKKVKVMHKMF